MLPAAPLIPQPKRCSQHETGFPSGTTPGRSGIVQPVATAVRDDPPTEETVLVPVPADANPTTFSLFIERPGANLDNSWPDKNADGTTLVGRIPLAAGAGTCCVVAPQQPLKSSRADFPRPSDDELRSNARCGCLIPRACSGPTVPGSSGPTKIVC
jgi:hypothetical protein